MGPEVCQPIEKTLVPCSLLAADAAAICCATRDFEQGCAVTCVQSFYTSVCTLFKLTVVYVFLAPKLSVRLLSDSIKPGSS